MDENLSGRIFVGYPNAMANEIMQMQCLANEIMKVVKLGADIISYVSILKEAY